MLSQVAFAAQAGLTQASVSQYENGLRTPDAEALKKICETFNINLNWLVTGIGPIYNVRARKDDMIQPTNIHDQAGYQVDLITIPVSAPIAAGYPIQVVEDEPLGIIQVPASLLSLPPPYYAFRIQGDSMAPFIIEDDTVILSRDWRGIKLHERICGFRTPDGITLKKLVLQPRQKTAWLMPFNHTYQPTPYNNDTDELVLIGVLTLLIRCF